MSTLLYRNNSFEVIKVSVFDQSWDVDTNFFTIVSDPLLPDGPAVVEDLPDGSQGPRRQLGFSKHYDVGSNTGRNSTQPEIDGYAALQTTDDNQLDADQATADVELNLRIRKVVKSIIKGAVREHNIISTHYNELRAEILAATNFNDLKTRVGANTTDAPLRTNAQAFNAVLADIDPND